jgi:hypothetical protein
MEIAGKGVALADRVRIPVRRNGCIDLTRPDIDASGIGLEPRRLTVLLLVGPPANGYLRPAALLTSIWHIRLLSLRLTARPRKESTLLIGISRVVSRL